MNSTHRSRNPFRRLGEASGIRRLLCALLVLAAAALVAGVVTEHLTVRTATSGPTQQPAHVDQGEGPGHVERGTESGTAPAVPVAGTATAAETETVLGLNTESIWLVAIAVMMSLGMAFLVLVTRNREVAFAAGVMAGAFVVLDCAELFHQAGEARPVVAGLAGLTKGLHLAAVVAAGIALLRFQRGRRQARA